MIGYYLNCLPRKFMRVIASHPSQIGCFDISRAKVIPSDKLLSMIWPELDSWNGRFGPQAGQVNDLAAAGLASLLHYLREVILQDSVILRRLFPSHPVWNHPVFQHTAYTAFAKEVEANHQDAEAEGPNQLSMFYQAMPQLADQLAALEARNEQSVRELKTSIEGIAQSQSTQLRQLHLLTSGRLTFRLDAPQLLQSLPQPLTATATSSNYASARASIEPEPASRDSSPIVPPELEPPKYRMCRALRTVESL
jgi:hypothetical protein